jgi:hypothetical protein
MFKIIRRYALVAAIVFLAGAALAGSAYANHSWAGYHWARSSSSFTLNVGDNLTSNWDPYLLTAISDWNPSTVLDLLRVNGASNPKNCKPTAGRVEACNSKYGNNGWLGIAQVWVSGEHITQGTVKLNDTYFSKAQYNTPAWRRLVVCQEVAHTFGLDHQDENFSNPNLGTCMDYTSDPDGTLANPDQLSNEHPNAHDFEELAIIYSHLDSASTVTAAAATSRQDVDLDEPSAWGQVVRYDSHGRPSAYSRNLGNGRKVVTHVLWAD